MGFSKFLLIRRLSKLIGKRQSIWTITSTLFVTKAGYYRAFNRLY
jgi:hypothetical protein